MRNILDVSQNMQHLTYYWIDILIEHLLKIKNDVSVFLILALLKTSLHITHYLLFSHICIFSLQSAL